MTYVREVKGGYLCVEPVHQELVTALCKLIPHVDRMPSENGWFVKVKHKDLVYALVSKYSSQATSTLDSAYKTLHLYPTAPMFVVDAVWKAFVRAMHPDVGGDQAEFLAIKSAYEYIKNGHAKT